MRMLLAIDSSVLRSVPNFPNYSCETFGYPERLIRKNDESLLVLGPPIRLYYSFRPPKSCEVYVSNIPDWASMSDVIEIFERFGKLYSVELSVKLKKDEKKSYSMSTSLSSNGWARVTYISYDGAQKALFAHMTRRISGTVTPLSIYKGTVSSVVLLKNVPASEPRAKVIDLITEYPGLMGISFKSQTTARLVFFDMDLALLFMDLVSNGGLVINGFTCTVEPEEEEEDDDDLGFADERIFL